MKMKGPFEWLFSSGTSMSPKRADSLKFHIGLIGPQPNLHPNMRIGCGNEIK